MSKLLPSVQYKGHCDTSSFFSHERNEMSSAFPKQYRNLSKREIIYQPEKTPQQIHYFKHKEIQLQVHVVFQFTYK